MAFGFVFHDVLYLTLIALLYGSAFTTARATFVVLTRWVPWFVAAPLAGVVALLTMIAIAGILTALCPKLTPGKHKVMGGKVFFSWMLRALIRRALFLPGAKWLIFSSHVLRFCALRALGADVAFTASMSTDVDALDPALLTVEAGAMIGARCLIVGHFVQEGKLLLDRVHIKKGALLAGEVIVLPGTRIGERVLIKGRTSISLGVEIGDGASIGAEVGIDNNVRIGKNARIGNVCTIGPRVQIADDAKIPWGTRLTADAAGEVAND
jgi:UDP-3-O-[3-hydroxymyristoyl] glucosamine N-acyltransferase